MQKKSISFQYLHRDEGNYKTFGEIIFGNDEDLSPEKAEETLRKKLIDTTYFYPLPNGIPLFQEHTGYIYFSDWYEFQKFSRTNEKPTDPRSLSTFLSQFSE
ncbi:hypothetical protein OQ279_01200 [Salinimicrobium sp. MT39]|uniref:Uncharacterized protein n=1 Tax=Salinimicrobium profundisediminis TaxID=2994553 RepID=A0A9X3HZU1_9FLAO|nr:hypothetical protein [Salinimicrobium profundisediminis]MCX2836753.1 hypothetical protein [Salinimicrobium profundisediminis]